MDKVSREPHVPLPAFGATRHARAAHRLPLLNPPATCCSARHASTQCYTSSSCDQVCGKNVDGQCTGAWKWSSESGCSCQEGWFGATCTKPCPGVNGTSGAGEVCGGYGTCNEKTNGTCVCDSGYTVDESVGGVCIPSECEHECKNGGTCELDSSSGNMTCTCMGAYTGADCGTCGCEYGSCNAVTRLCDCAENFAGTLCSYSTTLSPTYAPTTYETQKCKGE